MSCERARVALGAYVLGALEPAEREQVHDHLAGCPSCAEVLAELAPLPGLLSRVPAGSSVREQPPETLLDRTLARVRAATGPSLAVPAPVPGPRRRAPWWLPGAPPPAGGAHPLAGSGSGSSGRNRLLATATALLLAATTAGALAWPGGGRSAAPERFTAAQSAVRGTVTLATRDDATVVTLELRGVPAEQHCELVAVTRDGAQQNLDSWTATYGGAARVSVTSAVRRADLRELLVLTPSGRRLLAVPV